MGTDTMFGLTDAGGLITPNGSGRRLRFHMVNNAGIEIANVPEQKSQILLRPERSSICNVSLLTGCLK